MSTENKKNIIFRITIFCFFVTTIIVLDIFTKTIALNGPEMTITPFLNIYHSFNSGIAFGYMADLFHINIIMIGVTTIVLILISKYFIIWSNNIHMSAASMIYGGALGNLYDRICYYAVRDFIDLHIYDYHWPTFNMADFFICLGMFLIFIDSFKKNAIIKSE